MRIVVLVLAGWSGALVLSVGLFVALVRGGGGTDLAPLAADLPALQHRGPVEVPQPRAGADSLSPQR